MSDYTGLLTGNYYFQLNTGKGFLEATNDKTIGYTVNDLVHSYPHGLKRTSVNNLFGAGTTGVFAEFSVGADIFRIKKGSDESCEGTVESSDTKCILWDEKNNFIVGVSDSNPGIAGNSNANSILGGVTNCINTSDCSSILGGMTNTIANGYYSSTMGQCNQICNARYSNSFGYNNFIIGAAEGYISNSHILGCNNCISNCNTVIFGLNNISYGGDGNFIHGDSNIVCSQGAHFKGTILAGNSHQVYGTLNTILGGQLSRIGADSDQVDETYENYSLIGNGLGHYILGSLSTIINGRCNRNIGHHNFIGGGYENCINVTNYDLFNNPSQFDSIQDIIPKGNFIGNGYYNKILDTAQSSIIVGGKQNVIQSGIYSSILGGFNNSIENAPNSFIIGNRSHITNLLDITGGISGAGIISDGYAPVWNFESNKLLINFKNGIILTPGIKIESSLSMPKDGLESVAGDVRYSGYTGISYPNTIIESIRIVNIGVGNAVRDYTDISGLSTGENGVTLGGVFNRNYNPSVIVGNLNSGAHSNILLGLRNVHHSESYEYAKAGFPKWSGVYGEDFVKSGFLTGQIKTINNGPWASNVIWGWPVYQGANIMIGQYNDATGMKNIILGNQNNVSGLTNGSLVLGEGNAFLRPDTRFLLDPTSSAVTGAIYGTGLSLLIREVISIGFRNLNLGGTHSIDFGHSNMSKTTSSQVIGRRNWTTGDYLVALGSELSSKGYRSSNIGYGNLMMGESGYYNHILGYNNIIDDYSNNPVKGTYNNQLMGNINYVRGHNNLAIGQRNIIDTLSGFTGNYTNFSIAIGAQNNIYGSYNTLFGMYNRSTGLTNYIFGSYNNTQGFENTTVGLTNNNYGERSVILGNINAAYGVNNTIIGNQGYAVNSNQISLGGGDGLASWPGSSQKNYLFWKGITSGTTRSELMLDGVNAASNDYISGKAFIHSGMVWNGKINIIAAETGLGNIFTQERYVTVANKNNGIHIISNQLISSGISGTAPWGITLSGDNTNRAICVNATGEANKFIYWNIIGEFNQVFVPTNETIYRKDYSNNSINNNVLKSGYDLWSSIDPNMTIWQTAPKNFFR
jgi:hypothetical protein